MKKNVIGLLFLLVTLMAAGACVPERFGQDRLDQLCGSDCPTAVVLNTTGFEPAPHSTSFSNHCSIVLSGNETLLAGTAVVVANVMPNGFYNNWALVGFVDEHGEAIIGWIDADELGFWEPREVIGLIDHCSTP